MSLLCHYVHTGYAVGYKQFNKQGGNEIATTDAIAVHTKLHCGDLVKRAGYKFGAAYVLNEQDVENSKRLYIFGLNL